MAPRLRRKERHKLITLKDQGHQSSIVAPRMGVTVSFDTARRRLREFGFKYGLSGKHRQTLAYSDEEFQNMVLCYEKCSGKIRDARALFQEKYGVKVPLVAIKEGVAAYDEYYDSLQHKDEGSDSSEDTRSTCETETGSLNDDDAALFQESDEDSTSYNIINKRANSDSVQSITLLDVVKPLYVFTTRLDNMNIFKQNLNDMTTQDTLRSIIQESKPNITNFQQFQPIASSGSKATFELLVKKINQYNNSVTNIKTEIATTSNAPDLKLSENSLRLLKSCKHLYIPLSDCMKPNVITKHKTTNKISINTLPNPIDSTTIEKIEKYECVVIKNIYLNNTEIHNVLNGYPTEFYTTDGIITDQEIFYYVKPRKVIEFSNCCWSQNEYNIKHRFDAFFKNINNLTWYLRKPHSCIGKCSCCCQHLKDLKKRGALFNALVGVSQSNKSSEIRPVLHSFKQSPDPEGYLTKVLCYFRRRRPNKAILPGNLMANQPFKWCIKMNNYTEYYSLGPKTKGQRNIVISGCCWQKRQRTVSEFPPQIANLLSEPHRCEQFNCKCCCKITKSTLENATELNIPNVQTHNYESKHIPRWRKIERFVCLFNSNRPSHFGRKSKTTEVKTHDSKKETKINNRLQLQKSTNHTKKITIINQPIILPDETVLNEHVLNQIPGASMLIPPTPSQSIYTKQRTINQETPLNTNQIEGVSERTRLLLPNQPINTYQIPTANPQLNIPNLTPANPDLQDPAISALINNVLSKFDVHLTVDARGLVSANLQTPLHTMTTENLKMLATVLNNAQVQVDAVVSQLKNFDKNPAPAIAVPVFSTPMLTTPSVEKDLINFQENSFFHAYTLLTAQKINQYRRSFRNHTEFLNNPVIPVIQSVTSLAPPKSPKPSTSGVKRTVTDNQKKPEEHLIKKIRVKSPSRINNLIQDSLSIVSDRGDQNVPSVAISEMNNQAYYQFIHTAESPNMVPISITPATTVLPQPDLSEVPDQRKNEHLVNMLTNTNTPPFVTSLVPPPLLVRFPLLVPPPLLAAPPRAPAIEPKIEIEDDCILGV